MSSNITQLDVHFDQTILKLYPLVTINATTLRTSATFGILNQISRIVGLSRVSAVSKPQS